MNDITRALYLWLSNDYDLYQDIQDSVGNPKDLHNFVAVGMGIEGLSDAYEGMLIDILRLVNWVELFDDLIETD